MVERLDGLIAEAKSSWMNPYNTAHSSSRSPDSDVEEEQPEDNDVNDDTELNEVDQLSWGVVNPILPNYANADFEI